MNALKRTGRDTVAGLAIPYGGLFGGRDVDAEKFGPETDLLLDAFPNEGRPLFYDHGLDGEMKSTLVGSQVSKTIDDEGVWAESQIRASAKYRKAIDRLLEEERLGYSSGTFPQMFRKSKSGTILSWPWMELSLTPFPAAGPLTNVHFVKSAAYLELIEDSDTPLTLTAVKAIAAGLAEGDPDPASLDDKAGRVSAAVDDFRDHVRSAAEMRAKSGRVLSAVNRERISKALASREAVMAAYADLESLLSETDPEATKSARDVVDDLEIEAIFSRWAFGLSV